MLLRLLLSSRLIKVCGLWLFLATTNTSVSLATPNDGSVLPFAPTPMASNVAPRLQDSTMKWPELPKRIPDNAPNILIVMLDDVGFGVSEAFGGEVRTPNFYKISKRRN